MPTAAKFFIPGLIAIGLAACTPSSSDPQAPSTKPAAPAPADDKCNSGRVANLVGQPWNDSMLAQVKAAVGHDTIRVVGHNQPMTMDFREDRLTIQLGEDGKVVRLQCV